MKSFFSPLKTERTERKTFRTRNEARADVFDYIERFYSATRRHSTIGYLSPVEFEREVGKPGVHQTGSSSESVVERRSHGEIVSTMQQFDWRPARIFGFDRY
jgi:hypothetical protein